MEDEPKGKGSRLRGLVVGGSGGIGAAVCRQIASPGVELVVHGGHNHSKLRKLGDNLRSSGCLVHEIVRNIRTAEDGLELLRDAGMLDILVVAFGPLGESSVVGEGVDSIRHLSELNYVLPASLIATALPGMLERGYGRILVFGTTFGDRLQGYTRIASYAAPKLALASFVKSVGRQAAGADVRCNMICPGYVVTEYHSADSAHSYNRRSPGGRAQTPEKVAELAAWLLSEANLTVNGSVLAADDGL